MGMAACRAAAVAVHCSTGGGCIREHYLLHRISMVLCLGEEVLVVVEIEYVPVSGAIVLEIEVVDILHLVGGEIVVELVWRHSLYLALVQLGTYKLAQGADAAPVVVPLEVIVHAVKERLVAH